MSAGRLVLLHGFTQTSRSWDGTRATLALRAPELDVVAVDLPGHGGELAGPTVGDLWSQAHAMAAAAGRGTYVGYSLGGRVALHVALRRPDVVDRLVLVSTTAGIDDPGERAARRAADDALADRIGQIGVPAFVDEWLGNELFAGLDVTNDQRGDRLRNNADGLAASLRHAGTGTQDPLWDRLGEIEVPVLVVVGAKDDKFRALGERLVAGLPAATLAVIDGAGHTVHLEQPDRFVTSLVGWLDEPAGRHGDRPPRDPDGG